MGTYRSNRDRFTELLFENRNKSYGAYAIRTSYDRRLKISCMITLSLMMVMVFASGFFGKVKEVLPNIHVKQTPTCTVEVNLDTKHADPPKQAQQHAQPKGTRTGIPQPVDTTNKIADTDTTKFDPFAKAGDPKGTDTTDHNPVFAQGGGGTDTVRIKKPKEIVSVAEVNPEFPGGMEKLYEFFREHINYPKLALENEISGKVFLSFVVDEDGSIKDIKSLNAIGGGCEQEAVRVAGMMPKWKPGRMGDEPVPVRYNIPVRFAYK